MYHVAPKMEIRLGGKEVQEQSVFPEAQTDVLRQDVCGLPVAPEPRSNTCLSGPESLNRPKLKEHYLWVSRGSWSADRDQKKEVWRCQNKKLMWLLRDGKGSQIQRCFEFSTI